MSAQAQQRQAYARAAAGATAPSAWATAGACRPRSSCAACPAPDRTCRGAPGAWSRGRAASPGRARARDGHGRTRAGSRASASSRRKARFQRRPADDGAAIFCRTVCACRGHRISVSWPAPASEAAGTGGPDAALARLGPAGRLVISRPRRSRGLGAGDRDPPAETLGDVAGCEQHVVQHRWVGRVRGAAAVRGGGQGLRGAARAATFSTARRKGEQAPRSPSWPSASRVSCEASEAPWTPEAF